MEIIYRVYTEDKGLYADFATPDGYDGPIVIVEDGIEVGHY